MRAKKSIRAWVARDSSGRLFLYRNKPRKSTDEKIQYDNQKKLFKQYTHKYQ